MSDFIPEHAFAGVSGLSDGHVHTSNSFDSDEPVAAYCERGLELGLSGFTVTDHCEIVASGVSPHWSFETMARSRSDARAAAAEYAGRLEVLSGVELGQPDFDPDIAKRVLDADWDCVLASVHYLRDGEDFYYINFRDRTRDAHAIYESYLREVLLMAERSDYDSLAHMTYPLRYIVRRDRVELDETRYSALYDEILTAVAQRGKALELNTKISREGDDLTLPEPSMLSRFRELGGRYVTIGSDAHRAAVFAGGLGGGAERIKAAGFEGVTRFVGRKPVVTPFAD